MLVYDIQDVGARFYTYISTLGLAMEEAAKNKIRFVVLDRVNPINGLGSGRPAGRPRQTLVYGLPPASNSARDDRGRTGPALQYGARHQRGPARGQRRELASRILVR